MSTDLYWSLDEDLSLGEDGDIRDTSFDAFRSLQQEVRTRVMSSHYDWREHPSLGANLDELIGRPNNKITAEDGKAAIISALTLGGFLPRAAISVRYLPVTRHQIVYILGITVADVISGTTRMLKMQLLYDTIEGQGMVI